jgi:stalled ribosome rescue protein Dom34
MSFNHSVIWIDHQEAHVIYFNPSASQSEVIKTKSTHTNLHHKSGSVSGAHSVADHHFLHEVIQAVKESKEILIVGPGSAKLELMKHANRHDHVIAEKVVGIETVDHPSDGQLLAYAKKYFVKVDALKGDTVINP